MNVKLLVKNPHEEEISQSVGKKFKCVYFGTGLDSGQKHDLRLKPNSHFLS